MPKSRGRAKGKRRKSRGPRAVLPEQASTRSTKRASYRNRRRKRLAGWSLVTAGAVIGVSHWLSHLGFIRIASPGVEDVAIGYPVAVLLMVVGAMLIPA